MTTNVDNSASSIGYSSNEYACDDTNDKAFLLGYKEITDSEYVFSNSSDRLAYPTDYAKCQGAYSSDAGSYWWLRSLYYYDSDNARSVYYHYYILSGLVTNTYFGVRPAMRINLF